VGFDIGDTVRQMQVPEVDSYGVTVSAQTIEQVRAHSLHPTIQNQSSSL
jgi:hypothetical protein